MKKTKMLEKLFRRFKSRSDKLHKCFCKVSSNVFAC